ncbi:MAG: tRNA uridine-5-carboxymethylaminomethyl(34) synthesis GTPase MnmE [Nitrospinae bacterium RIFCSPLOWO2_12_39_16]|nr:MAG: tRNA uridine-5-carboxymethylaminomethyl(34) synthesis GTPase MnmE [Nitrospinae bacterium RIFCSPLOWO2_12_39_16]
MFDLTDTISAISTPPGEGGIGIVRVSGPASISIAKKIFTTPKGESLNGVESHKLIHGYIKDPDTRKNIDEVLLAVMHSPKSFTGEDVVEISCHGGSLPLNKILSLTIKSGARLAEPGEFTKRAFLNGRLNLLQAEAVIDIIKSKSDTALESAMNQLQGGLAKQIASIRNKLIDILAEIETDIDFPEEDIEFKNKLEFKKGLESVLTEIGQLVDSYRYGKIYREGVSVVIAGRPNVGKSSLMNALLNEERAIVTSIPGTTRDTIEEGLNINGLTIKIVDTAGIRESEGFVEQEGIKRTQKAIEGAGLIIFLLDGSEGLREKDKDLIKEIKQKNKPVIIAINKIDVGNKNSSEWTGGEFLKISALKNIGLDELRNKIFDIIYNGHCKTPEGIFITRERHRERLSKAHDSLSKAVNAINQNLSSEFIAADLRLSLESLGEITGETYSEDVLNRIFQEFCIGK